MYGCKCWLCLPRTLRRGNTPPIIDSNPSFASVHRKDYVCCDLHHCQHITCPELLRLRAHPKRPKSLSYNLLRDPVRCAGSRTLEPMHSVDRRAAIFSSQRPAVVSSYVTQLIVNAFIRVAYGGLPATRNQDVLLRSLLHFCLRSYTRFVRKFQM